LLQRTDGNSVPTENGQMQVVDKSVFRRYTLGMDTKQRKRGRPRKDPDRTKADYLDIRLGASEKQAFRDAAELAGLDLSAWVRERLRTAARKELEGADRSVAFLARLRRHGGDGSGVDG